MQNEVMLNMYNCILIKHTFTCISVVDLGIANGGFEDFACKARSEKCVAMCRRVMCRRAKMCRRVMRS